jgi:hypothetical protein
MSQHHAIGRLLYEIAINADLPRHVWAAAMMFFHAFEEYTIEHSTKERVSRIMVGVTCLVLSVKSNENYLVSKGSTLNPVLRLLGLLDSAARVVVSYTANQASSEKIVDTKKRLKEFIPVVELALMRVVGNSLVPDTAFLDPNLNNKEDALLVEIYSSPVCLNFPAADILAFTRGQRDNKAIGDAIEHFFL